MTDKTERDALVARVWEAIGTYSVQVATTGELAPSPALCEAIEALAAPADGGQGEAAAWRIRCGGQNLWGYCANESQADFYGKASGVSYEKQPLYTNPPAASVE